MEKITYTRIAFKLLLKEFNKSGHNTMAVSEMKNLFREYCELNKIKCNINSAVSIAIKRLMFLKYIRREGKGFYAKN